MKYLRKASERGHADHGWLNSYHTFSFADYYDPRHMGFRDLRVINDDTVEGGAGFPFHPHQDMEIVTYILDGELEHKDTMNNSEVIRPFEVQRMSAGQGVRHSEFNPSPDKPVHLLQIWIMTEKLGIEPSYEQKNFKDQILSQNLTLVASGSPRNGSLKIYQDVDIYVGKMAKDKSEVYSLRNGRHAYIHVARGSVRVNDILLATGDGLGVSEESSLTIHPQDDAEFLLFDLN